MLTDDGVYRSISDRYVLRLEIEKKTLLVDQTAISLMLEVDNAF